MHKLRLPAAEDRKNLNSTEQKKFQKEVLALLEKRNNTND